MSSIYDWSTTAASNSNSDGDINWAEGQAPSTVNNSARQMMGRLAEFVGDVGGALTTGGTANAITVTANSSFTAHAAGLVVAFKAGADNTGSTTLNVNSVGAKQIRVQTLNGDVALSGGEIQQNGTFIVVYNTSLNSGAGGWQLMNPAAISPDQLPTPFTITSTDAGAGGGPLIVLYRDSASPAATDNIGILRFQGEDSAGNAEIYGQIASVIDDATSGSEDGALIAQVAVAGSLTNLMRVSAGSVDPGTSDGAALGSTGRQWSDLFLASGGIINFNSGDVTVSHSSNALTFAGASAGYTFDAAGTFSGAVSPGADDGAALGSTSLKWSDLFLASGAVVNFNNGDVTITHSANALAFAGASGYTFDAAGTFSGNFTGNHIISTNGTFAHGSSGTMIFRPQGIGSVTNQMTYSTTGNLTVANNITAGGDITASSDVRLKDDIATIQSALDIARSLRGVTFTRKRDGSRGTGFIAQEVQSVAPELVATDGEGYLSVAYGNVTAILVEAVKELAARVEALEARE